MTSLIAEGLLRKEGSWERRVIVEYERGGYSVIEMTLPPGKHVWQGVRTEPKDSLASALRKFSKIIIEDQEA